MLLTAILLLSLGGLFVVYFKHLKVKHDYFKRRGIAGPAPGLFFGHCRTLWSVQSLSRQLQQWTRQFGSIYGLFEGTLPVYVVSDVDFLEEVYFKQFSSFHSRHIPFTMRLLKQTDIGLFAANNEHQWHRQRRVINPTFSLAKLKLMTPLINHCVQSLMDKLKELEEQQAEFDAYPLYKRLTMDIIGRCAFGIDTNMQVDVDNEYMTKAELIFSDDLEKHWSIRLSKLLPWLTPLLAAIKITEAVLRGCAHKVIRGVKENPRLWFLKHVRDIVQVRLANPANRRVDLLQLMLDATTDERIDDDVSKDQPSHHIRREEMISNIFLFLLAGYETTATALAYCTYMLATKPEYQEKLRAEIDQHHTHEDKSDEKICRIGYLDMFVREVLRMHPIAPTAPSRVCSEDTSVCGHLIEKGSVIQADMFSLHYSKELWGPDDPYEFRPERHLTERHRLAFMPFGQGPRNCVGMRFALMELKLCLTDLLRQYVILPGEHTEEKFQIHDKHIIRRPEAIMIKLRKRSDT